VKYYNNGHPPPWQTRPPNGPGALHNAPRTSSLDRSVPPSGKLPPPPPCIFTPWIILRHDVLDFCIKYFFYDIHDETWKINRQVLRVCTHTTLYTRVYISAFAHTRKFVVYHEYTPDEALNVRPGETIDVFFIFSYFSIFSLSIGIVAKYVKYRSLQHTRRARVFGKSLGRARVLVTNILPLSRIARIWPSPDQFSV